MGVEDVVGTQCPYAEELPAERLDGTARYYATVVQGLSIQARDGATRDELEAVIGCAMQSWAYPARPER
ncbi:hypothetical protein [Actinoplanes sp. NPDC020271]|uniref:hypothetical protein n=1 Tax=Actinoplanes sp. NPDC020271 TaxID=3363896 RepID=UPI0037A6AE0E